MDYKIIAYSITIKTNRLNDIESFEKKFDSNWLQKNNLNSILPSNEKSPSKKRILLVRHGQYFHSTGHLTETGRIQAAYTGHYLKEFLKDKKFKLFSSTAIRAQETAKIIGKIILEKGQTIKEYEELCEGFPCLPENGDEKRINVIIGNF